MTQSDMKDIFAQNLKAVMQERNMNQAQLAKAAETTPQNISKYCKASVLPDLGIVVQIANALNVSVDSLLGNEGFSKKKKCNRFLLSDLLEQLVIIADTLNFNISDCGCSFKEYHVPFEFEAIQLSIGCFLDKWAKYRKLLEENDIERSDYDTLISTQLRNLLNGPLYKNQLLDMKIEAEKYRRWHGEPMPDKLLVNMIETKDKKIALDASNTEDDIRR